MKKAIGTFDRVSLRARHREEAVDGVVLNAARGKTHVRRPSFENAPDILNVALGCCVRFREPAYELRFAIGLRSGLLKVGQILEKIPHQVGVARTYLLVGDGDNVSRVLRNGNFERSISVASAATLAGRFVVRKNPMVRSYVKIGE